MKTIEVIVSPSGETKIETKGFVGTECQRASRFIEETLGSKQSETLTAEFHQTTRRLQQFNDLRGGRFE